MEKLSTSEKWNLLGALYKHGSREDKLTLDDSLKDWNPKQIKKTVQSYRARAKRSLQTPAFSDQAPIDMWYDFISNCHRIEGTNNRNPAKRRKFDSETVSYSHLLEKSMLYAACFEDHYQGSSPDDPNYNEIYRYLAQLLAGEEPTQLRPGNAKKIVEMMSKLKNLLSDETIQRYVNYVTQTHSVSYVKPGVDIESIVLEKINTAPEVDLAEASRLFKDPDGHTSDPKISSLDKKDSQYLILKEKAILKLSLKQRALASTISNIPGVNPLEMVLASLVKPPVALEHEKLLMNGVKSKKKTAGPSQ